MRSMPLPISDVSLIPRHIALIPDGNRRWAKEHGLSTMEGHLKGYERVNELARVAQDMGVQAVTVWGFSTENWSREGLEREYLFGLFMRALRVIARQARKRKVRIRHLGRKDRLPAMIIHYLKKLEDSTKHHDQFQLNIALDYGGRDEILRAIRHVIDDGVPSAKLDEALFSQYLDTQGMTDPDFIIRTSGEQRVSGLLPWQSDYAEFYFTPVYLPDFDEQQFRLAIAEFGRRQRRFGK
jgi:undecaprenyl diphosphate synthase